MGIIGMYDGNWTFLTIEIEGKGFVGTWLDEDAIYIAGNQKVYRYENFHQKPADIYESHHFRGLHSIWKTDDKLQVVSAYKNAVYEIDLISKHIDVLCRCKSHPNSIYENYVTLLNKNQASAVFNIEMGEYTSNELWKLSHNYRPYEDGYVILNGDGRLLRDDKCICYLPGRFLRGLLIKDHIAYVGSNIFMDVNRRNYRPPEIAVVDFKLGNLQKLIHIPLGAPWVIYDIVECNDLGEKAFNR